MEENSEVSMDTEEHSITSSTPDSDQVTGLYGNMETVIVVEEVKEEDVSNNSTPTTSPSRPINVQGSALSSKLLTDKDQPKTMEGQSLTEPEQGQNTIESIENLQNTATKSNKVQRAPIKLVRMYRNPSKIQVLHQSTSKSEQHQTSLSTTDQVPKKLDQIPNTQSPVEQGPKKKDQMPKTSKPEEMPNMSDPILNIPSVVEQGPKKMDQVQKTPFAIGQNSQEVDQGQKPQSVPEQVPKKSVPKLDLVQKTLPMSEEVQNTPKKDPKTPSKSAKSETNLTLDDPKKLDQVETILGQKTPRASPIKSSQQVEKVMVITGNEIPSNLSGIADAALEKSIKETGHQSTNETSGKSDLLVNKFESKSNKSVSKTDSQLNKSVTESVSQLNTSVNKSESLLNNLVSESQLNKTVNESDINKSVSKSDSQSNKSELQLNKSVNKAESQLNISDKTLNSSGLSENSINEEQNSVEDCSENADQIKEPTERINGDKNDQNINEVVANTAMDICEQSNDSIVETNSDISEKEHNKSISRELKSLINSAKESKIISECTQLTSKTRKSKTAADSTNTSLNTTVEIDKKRVIKSRSSSREKSTKSPSRRSMRSQNPEFANKVKQFLNLLTGKNQKEEELDESKKESQTENKSPSAKKKKLMESSEFVDQRMNRLRSDLYCWRCHWTVEQVANERGHPPLLCTVCPRSFHFKCLSGTERNKTSDEQSWICPECLIVLHAESSETRSPAMKKISLGLLCELLQHALCRMMELNGVEPFMYPVDRTAYPDYDKFVVHPMDLSLMKKNISEGLYGSTEAFLVDAQWILHNSIIFNSSTSMTQTKLSTVARAVVRTCRAEMCEIEACPECYAAAHARRPTWFTDVCSTPHILLWAKLKGFPYWPAKAMTVNSQGMVDVRFFGAHDRAWVPARDCFLFCEKDPNNFKAKRQDMIESMQEVENHISSISRKYGKFVYAPYRTPFEPTNLTEQLKIMIPTFEGDVLVKAQVKEKLVRSSSPNKIKDKRRRSRSLSCKRSVTESDTSENEVALMNKKNDNRRRSRSKSSKRTVNESDISEIEEALITRINERSRRFRSKSLKRTVIESDVNEIEDTLMNEKNDKRRRSRSKSSKRTINESDVSENDEALMNKLNAKRRRSRSKSSKRTVTGSDVSENDEALMNKRNAKKRRSRSKSSKRTVTGSDVSENDEALMNKTNNKKRRSRSKSSKRTINESENEEVSTNKMRDKRPHRSRSRTCKKVTGSKNDEAKAISTQSTADIAGDVREKDDASVEKNTVIEVDEQNAQNKEMLSRDKRETFRKRRRSDLEEAVMTIVIPRAEKRKKGEAVINDEVSNNAKDNKKAESGEKKSEKIVENEPNRSDIAVEKANDIVNDMEVPTTPNITKEAPISKSDKALATSTPKSKLRGRPRKTSTPKEQEKAMNSKQKSVQADKIYQDKKGQPDDHPVSGTRASRSKARSKSVNSSPVMEVIEKSVDRENDKDNTTNITIDKEIEPEIPPGTKEHEAQKPVDDSAVLQTRTSKSKTRSKSLTRSQATEVEETSIDKTNDDILIHKTVNKTNEPKSLPGTKINEGEKPVKAQNKPSGPTGGLKVVDRLQFDDDTSLADIAREVPKKSVSGLPTITSVRSLCGATQNTTTTTVTNPKTIEITVSANSAANVFTPTITDKASNMKEAVDKLHKLRNNADSSKPLVGRVGVRSFARMTSPPAPLEKENTNETVQVEVKSEPIELDDADRRLEKIDLMNCINLRPVNPVSSTNLRDVRINKVVVSSAARKAPEKVAEVRVRARKTFPSPRKDATEGRSELNGKNSMVYIPIQPPTAQAPTQRLPRPIAINGTANAQAIRHNAPVTILNNTVVNTQTAPLSTSLPVTTATAVAAAKPTNTVATNSHTKAICVPAAGQIPTIGHVPTVGQVPTTVHTVPLITSVNGQWTFSLQPMMSVGGDGTASPPVVNGLSERNPQFIPVAPSNPLTLLPAASLLPNNASSTTNSSATCDNTPAEMPRLQQRPPMVNPLDPNAPAGPVPVPSTAGPITAKLTQYSVKLADFFRNFLEDSIEKMDDAASQLTALMLQLEQAKWKHTQEINELNRTHELLTTEMRVAYEKEKARAISELRRVAQGELEAAVKAAKTKQWCANCSQEAQFYCCWNTSYCDYSCQRSHWSQHYAVCTQPRNTENNSNENGNSLDKRLQSGPENLPALQKSASAPAPAAGTMITPTRVYAQAQDAAAHPQKTSIIVSMVEDPSGNQMVKCVGTYKPPGTQPVLLNKQAVNDENAAKKVTTSGGYLIVGASNNPTSVASSRRNHPLQYTYNT